MQQKDERANFRMSKDEKDLIMKAAKLQKKTFSAFVTESSFNAASEMLASQNHFVLPKDKWEEFCTILDRDPVEKPNLTKLLKESTILDE